MALCIFMKFELLLAAGHVTKLLQFLRKQKMPNSLVKDHVIKKAGRVAIKPKVIDWLISHTSGQYCCKV